MLQRIRERISGWIAGVIIALVAGAFMLFGVEYYFNQGDAGQNNVAKVNGIFITDSQLQQAVAQTENQYIQQTGKPLPAGAATQLRAYALQSLVMQTGLSTSLMKNDFRVGLLQAKMLIEQAPQFQVNGQFSKEKFLQMLYNIGLSPEAFFQHVQSQWLIQQTTQGVAATAFSLPQEINSLYGLQNQARAFGYFLVPMNRFAGKVSVTQNEIAQNYTENKAFYETPLEVSASYILLSPQAIEKKIQVTEEEAKAYYQSHLSNFAVPARWTVSQILVPVSANASAADVEAAQNKADQIEKQLASHQKPNIAPTTATFSEMTLDPAMLTTLSSLKAGEYSQPFRTTTGFALLKVEKHEVATTRPFASVEKNLMTMLQRQRVNDVLTRDSTTLANLTYTNPNSLESAAKALNLSIQVTPMISKAGEKTGIFSNPAVLKALFSDSVFKSGNNSDVITLQDGSRLVLRVAQKQESKPIPLKTVENNIKQSLLNQKMQAQAGLLAYQLQTDLTSGQSPEALSKKYALTWKTVALTSQNAKSTTPGAIIQNAFSIPVSAAQHKWLAVQANLLNPQSYIVIGITQVKNADVAKATAAQKQKVDQQLTVLWAKLLQHCFVGSQMADAKIKIYPQKTT